METIWKLVSTNRIHVICLLDSIVLGYVIKLMAAAVMVPYIHDNASRITFLHIH